MSEKKLFTEILITFVTEMFWVFFIHVTIRKEENKVPKLSTFAF